MTKRQINFYPLNGSKKNIRECAYAIAGLTSRYLNARIAAFDKDNNVLWSIQAGGGIEKASSIISWSGVVRVEICDNSTDGIYRYDDIYISNNKSLLDYFNNEIKQQDFDSDIVLNYSAIWD